jgi:Anti-sigma-K factor rskA/Sigma-70, region 4
MATFDQLSADQRAIIELVLQQEKSYADLADLLGMSEDRVRELARAALVTLTPVTASRVEDDWQGQLADYVLGQQTGPESTATKGHLRRSEPARAWARSLLDSLDTLYVDGMPQVPEGERGRPARERRPRREREEPAERPSRRELSDEARGAVRRRRLLGAGALALVAAFVVFVWPVGIFSDDDEGGSSGQAASQGQPAGGQGPAGIAVVAERNNQRQVIVQATLQPNRQREAYEVWLYNNKGDAKSLGAQVTDQRGTYQGAGPLPSDYSKYEFIDVSREPIDQNRAHSGQSVLRGKIPRLKQPQNARRGQASILGQVVLQPVQ